MAVTQETLFRVVQIFKGNIIKDLVLRVPRPVTMGVHKDYDLVAPLPGQEPGYTLFEPTANGRYQLNVPSAGGQQVLEGKLTRADGSTASAQELANLGGKVALAPGDWALFKVAGSDDAEVFCQYVRIPVRRRAARIGDAFAWLAVDQWTVLAGVTVGIILMLCFLHMPHGTTFQSEEISRRFSTMIRNAPKRREKQKKDDADKRRKAVVIREAQELIRRPQRESGRTERVTLSRRDVRNRRINKGGLLALNRAIRSSNAVNRLFRQQDGLLADVEKGLSGLTGPGSSGGGSGDGIEDPYATRGAGGDSVGKTDGGTGPNLGRPIGARGTLTGRGFRQVRVAQVGLGGGSVSGTGLSRAQIFSVVRARRGFIKWCYENALKQNPAMGGGKIGVQFKISPDGRVAQARVAANSLQGGGTVGACITRAIRRWRFPLSKGYSVVRFPFLFSSGLK
ncbi:MAG: AgmX/PglI C-terminal domain-containing protein [bacterium]